MEFLSNTIHKLTKKSRMEDEIKLVAYDPMALVKYMDEYFNTKTPDCSFYSEDGHEILVHCEVLYQTKWVVYFYSEN